jgi:hypothetical protein
LGQSYEALRPVAFCFFISRSSPLSTAAIMVSTGEAQSRSIMSMLTFGNLFLAFVAYITFKVLYQIIHYRFFHPLSKFPGMSFVHGVLQHQLTVIRPVLGQCYSTMGCIPQFQRRRVRD